MDTKIEKILRLVQEGKMSPEEADTLLGLLKMKDKPGKKGCHLKIKVVKSDDDKDTNVNLNLPINFVKMMVKATGKFSIDVVGKNRAVRESLQNAGLQFDNEGKIIDMDAFLQALDSLCENSPVDIADIQASDDDGDVNIKIFID